MPNKRSRKNKTQKFYCSKCLRRLWRVGGRKYYLFYHGTSEIQSGFKLTHKKAKFLAHQNPVCVNQNVWLEEFFCEKHGTTWMHVSRLDQGTLLSRPARREDWQRTSHTENPDRPGFSVSDFTYQMSRGSHPKHIQKYSH